MSNEKCFPKDAIQPAGMLFASSVNFLGALAGLIVSPETRTNPFFYCAMFTSCLYMASNGLRVKQLWNKPKEIVPLNTVIVERITRINETKIEMAEEALNRYYAGRN